MLLLTSSALRLTAAVHYNLQSGIDASVLSVLMQSSAMYITVLLHMLWNSCVLLGHVKYCFSQQMCAYIKLLGLSSGTAI